MNSKKIMELLYILLNIIATSILILTSFEMLDANDLHPNNGYVELW